MKKLTKKQMRMLDVIYEDIDDLAEKMKDKITLKTMEGVVGWEKMNYDTLLTKANDKFIEACCGDKTQIVDAANYLLFAWIKSGKP